MRWTLHVYGGNLVEEFDNPAYWCGEIGYRPPGYADFTVNTLKEICVMLLRPQSILDVGCAFGFSVQRLRVCGYDAWGLDISKYALSRANEQTRPYLVQGFAWNMPFSDKQFDLIFSSGVLEHLPEDRLTRAVEEILRVGNRGLIGVSCSDDPSTRLGEDKTHKILLSRQEWQKLFPATFIIISDSETSWRGLATGWIWASLKGEHERP